MIRLVPRAAPSAAWSYLAPVLAVALTVLVGFVLFALMGYDPLRNPLPFLHLAAHSALRSWRSWWSRRRRWC